MFTLNSFYYHIQQKSIIWNWFQRFIVSDNFKAKSKKNCSKNCFYWVSLTQKRCWPWLHKSVHIFKHLLSDFTSMWHILTCFSCTNIWVHVLLGLNKYKKVYYYFYVNTWLSCPHITNARWQANAKCVKHTWSFKFE